VTLRKGIGYAIQMALRAGRRSNGTRLARRAWPRG